MEDKTDYPLFPGFVSGSDTSKAAAEAISDPAPTIRGNVLYVLERHSMTADEVANALNHSILTVRPRVTKLRKVGLVRDTGQRRANESGKRAAVMTGRP